MGKIKDPFDAELWTTSGALKIGIKRTRHINTTTVAFFIKSGQNKNSRAKDQDWWRQNQRPYLLKGA